MLEVNDIQTYYGNSHILHGVSLSVQEGSLSVILGKNGMGKTTTIRSVIGFTAPKSGEVLFRNKEIQKLPSYEISKLGVGLAPQGRRIFPNLTVKENLQLAARKGNGKEWNLKKIYDFFPRLKERATSMGGYLSGGEQQMLSIGRALMTNPDLLLLDEPSEGLSPKLVQDVMNIINDIKKEGISMLMVEQNISMALTVADHVYILSKGQVVFDGTPEDLLNNEDVKERHLGLGMSAS